MRKVLFGLICFIVILLLIGLDIRITMNDEGEEVELDLQLEDEDTGFVFLDIPNGEATYIKLPNEEVVLIGTGSPDSKEALFFRLRKLNVQTVNTIILPRFEKEYSGNVEELVNKMKTNKLIVPKQGLEQAKQQFAHLSIDIVGWDDLETKTLSSGVEVETLSTDSSLIPKLSFIVTVHEKHQFFFASEANEALEKRWIEAGLLPVAVLKVAEFGSGDGTTQSFLNEIDPQVAIVYSKQDGSVSGQLLERLQETWIDTYRTELNGSVIIKANSIDYELVTVHF